jgi:peroxiredoxin (alkyl hydroperoxide reductase subunit C)
MSIINKPVPVFKNKAYQNGKFIDVSNETIKGKWTVFIFMPAAFTFNCPTEVEDAAANYAEFEKVGAEVLVVTTTRTSRTRSGTTRRPPSASRSSRSSATRPTC